MRPTLSSSALVLALVTAAALAPVASKSGVALAQPSASSSSPLASGTAALARADYEAAARELSKVKGAGEGEAQLGLARAAFEQGKIDAAEKHAQQAGARGQALAATAMRAEILAARGKLDEAVKLLEGAVRGAKGGPARRARLLLGEYLLLLGKRADAEGPLHDVIGEYNDGTVTSRDAEGLAHIGRAAFLLRSPKDANTAFKESERADKNRVETKLWAAELFLDKYDPGHAEEEVREAFAIAPGRADVLVAMARVKLEQTLDFAEAAVLTDKALAVNPRHVGALAVRAGLALRDMDIARADAVIREGLAATPGDLELLSLKAATRFLDDDKAGFEAVKREVFAKNPEYARFYVIVTEYAEWEHRYDDVVVMMKEATRIDPADGRAWAELGLTQMRGGDETTGLESLKKAWSKDKFNVRVFNTMNMYENEIANDYETTPDGAFKIRYAKDEKPVLERYVPRLLGEAWGSMKARYGFVPQVPVQIELYASRQSFSIRTSGLPNIGIQGVCFGRVIAAISPKAEPFNYGNVLWHELGHVFAIQLSKNHVPRWFTEGLSEYETIARRPEWARELDPELYGAIKSGKLPAAVDMNRAFTHAKGAGDMTIAYYASSQMLVWTVERFGMAKVVAALRLWGEGKKTPEVLTLAFGVSPAEYDRQYRAWQLARLSRYDGQYVSTLEAKEVDEAKAAVDSTPPAPPAARARAHAEMALAYARAKKFDEAKKEVAAALASDPKSGDARYVGAQLARAEKDVAGARAHLDAMRSSGNDGYVVHSMLAEIASDEDDEVRLRFHLEAAHRFDPSQSEPLRGLFDLATKEKREADALVVLEKLAWLEQHDRKVWRLLLERFVQAERWEDARRVGEGAVFVDVLGGPTHVLYARALAAGAAHGKAIAELEAALDCGGKPKERAVAHALLARSLAAVGRTSEARTNLQEALKLDPENVEAKGIRVP